MTHARRAIIYARISLDQSGEGVGVERQRTECLSLVTSKGWELAGVYADNSISAYDGSVRPEFERALAALQSGEADTLVVWHLDRAARRPADLERLLTIPGLLIEPVTGTPIQQTDASAALTAYLLTSVSQYESQHKAERVRAAARHRALSGKLPGKIWGYNDDGSATEEAKAAIPAAFDAFLRTQNLAESHRVFSRHAPSAARSRGAHRVRLQQAAYAGIVTYRGAEHPDVEPQWEPVIPESTFRRVQAILSRPTRKLTSHRRGIVHALGTGVYVCGQCGDWMMASGMNTGKHGTNRPVYRCRSNKHLNRDRFGLDVGVMVALLGRLELANMDEALLPRSGWDEPAAADLLADRERRTEQLRLFHEDLLAGRLDRALALDLIAQAKDELAAIDDELARLEVDPDTPPLPYDVYATLTSLPLETLRKVIAAVMRVKIMPMASGGVRRKGQRVWLRPNAFTIDWLGQPRTLSDKALSEVPDWTIFRGQTLTDSDGERVHAPVWPDWTDWVLAEVVKSGRSPLPDPVRAQVWRLVEPFAVGVDYSRTRDDWVAEFMRILR